MRPASAGARVPWLGLRLVLIGLIVLALVALYWILARHGQLSALADTEALRGYLARNGIWSPLLVIALMALAVVVNPIPSAPIAIAAGAVFGHTWGTVYVVIGAELGAMAAFALARLLGYGLLKELLGERVRLGWLGSQNALTGLVLFSRLLPFISFDLVSYGAGLTPLRFWRFALATLIGLIPASFLLAHFGGALAGEELGRMMTTVLLLGLITVVPLALRFLWLHRRHGETL